VRKRWAVILGWAWPFIVAAGGVAVVATGHRLTGDQAMVLLFGSLLGAPVIPQTVWGWLPTRWPEGWRFLAAILLTGPILVAEVYLAIILFVVGTNWTGYGWVE
jgi:hypothetical protein